MKMYKKPTTDVMDIKTESLMQGIVVSVNGGGGGGGTAGMPKRGEVIN